MLLRQLHTCSKQCKIILYQLFNRFRVNDDLEAVVQSVQKFNIQQSYVNTVTAIDTKHIIPIAKHDSSATESFVNIWYTVYFSRNTKMDEYLWRQAKCGLCRLEIVQRASRKLIAVARETETVSKYNTRTKQIFRPRQSQRFLVVHRVTRIGKNSTWPSHVPFIRTINRES